MFLCSKYIKLLFFVFLSFTSTHASECLFKEEFSQYRCSGTVKVKTVSELNNYLTNYGLKKNVIKNLEIDFPIDTGQVFNIHSPCHIKFTSNANIDQSNNLCLYSKEDIRFSENLTINLGGDLKITSEDRIIFLDNLRLNANNVELKSFGTSFESRVRFSKDSTINVQNLTISSNERAVIGERVNVKATEAIRIYSKQDLTTDTNIEDNIFLRSNSKLEASTIEVQAKSNLRFGSNVLLKASEVILNGKGCTLGKTVVIDSPNKLGNCFLASVGKGWFSADVVKGQKPLTVNFKVNSEKAPVGFYYHWHLGNGDIIKTATPSLSYTYQNSGVFTARLKIQEQEAYPKKLKDGGSLNIEVSDITNLPPVSMLNCSTNNLLIQCEGLGSYDPEGAPLTYEFIYSDGYREENFTGLSTHSVASPGLVTVTLKVRDFQGLEAQSIAYAQATLPPNINPVAKVQCESTKPQTVKCNGLGSVDSDGSIILYEYFIESNLVQSLSNQNEFEIKLSGSGLKPVELKVTDNQGGVGSASFEVSVLENKAPEFNLVASILESEVPYNTIVQVTNISDDSEISEIKLSFSDGEIQFGESVNKLVEEAGELIVTASVTDEFGLVTSKTLTLKGLEKPPVPPVAFFKYNSFQDSYFFLQHFIEVGSSEIVEAYYLIDAGTEHETRIAISDFNVNGLTTYNLGNLEERTITLKVRDEKGLTSEFTHNAELSEDWDNVKPYLDVDLKKTTPRTVLLDFSKSFDLDREWLMSRYEIDYGNGHTQVVEGKQYALYQYPETGNYLIKVRGISERDAVSEKELQVEIDNTDHGILNPKANFTYQIFDIAMHVTFNIDGSVTSNGEILSYEWDFGDGETGLGGKVAHFYEPGIYDVKLTITDSFGLKSSQVQRVTILEGGDDLISFIDCYQRFDAYAECEVMALDKFKEINYLKIDWGDESEKFITEPVTEPYQTYNVGHIFKESGSYEVNYYVGTTRGQVRRETQTIDVEVTDYLGANLQCFVNEMRVTCNALGFYDTHLSNIHYEFDFGDNTVVTNDEGLASHSYAGPGTYQVKLKVTNDSGVEATAERTVMVLDPVGNQAPVARFQCDSYGPLVLRCFDTGSFDPDGIIVEKTITFHDGTSEMLDTPYSFKEYEEAGTYAVTLTLVDDSGLETVVTREFEVRGNNAPVAYLQCAIGQYGYLGCDSFVSDPDQDAVYVEWFLNDELISNQRFLEVEELESGFYKVTLKATDIRGSSVLVDQFIQIQFGAPPRISANCGVMDNRSIKCHSKLDPRVDKNNSQINWYIDGQFYQKNSDIVYGAPNLEPVRVEVELIEANGKNTKINLGEFTPKYTFMFGLSCQEFINKTKCVASSLDNPGVVNFKWTFDGQEINGDKSVFDTSIEDKEKVITLEGRDSFGNVKIEQYILSLDGYLDYEYEENLYSIEKEDGQIFVNSIDALKIKKVTSLDFSVVKVFINEALIEADNVIINQDGNIQVQSALNDGENDIRLELLDQSGELVYTKIKFYAGVKVVTVQVNVPEKIDVQLIDIENRNEKVGSISVVGGESILKYVPNLKFILSAEGGLLVGADVLREEESVKYIVLNSLTGEVTSNDFSKDIDSFVSEGSIEKINNSVVASNTLGERVHFKKISKPDENAYLEGSLQIGYGLFSPASAVGIVTVKNLKTGKQNKKIWYPSEIPSSSIENNSVRFYESIEYLSLGDEIVLDINVIRTEPEPLESSSYIDNVLDHLVKKVSAVYDPSSVIIILDPLETKSFIKDFEILNHIQASEYHFSNYSERKLDGLSIGRYPEFFDWKKYNLNIYNKIKKESIRVIDDREFIATNPLKMMAKFGEGVSLLETKFEILRYDQLNSKKVAYVQYADSDEFRKLGFSHFLLQSQTYLSPSDYIGVDGRNKRVEIQVTFVLDNGATVVFKKDYFPLFSTITNIYQFHQVVKSCNGVSNYHYSGRDCRRGTDSWAAPSFVNYVAKNIEVFKRSTRTVLYNDFSVMNGGDVKDHKSHEIGTSLDLRLLDSNKHGFSQGRTEPIFEKSVADELISMFVNEYDKDRVSSIEKIFITFEPNRPFISKLETMCLPDGRMFLDTNDSSRSLIKYRDKHSDHLHIEYSDRTQEIPGSRISDDPNRYSVQLISENDYQFKIFDNLLGKYVNPNSHVLLGGADIGKEGEFERGDNINLNKHYKGNGIYDVSSEIEYLNSASTRGVDLYFYNNSEIPFSRKVGLKIIDKGDRNRGRACNESSFLIVDLMIKKPLIFCPISRGSYSIEIAGKTFTGLDYKEEIRSDGKINAQIICRIYRINSLVSQKIDFKVKSVPTGYENGELEDAFSIDINSDAWNDIGLENGPGIGMRWVIDVNGYELGIERVFRANQWYQSPNVVRSFEFKEFSKE